MNQPSQIVKVPVPVRGIFKAKQMIEVGGRRYGLDDDAVADVRDELVAKVSRQGFKLQDIVRENLVVNGGRQMICRLLAGDVSSKIYAVGFGDTKVDGVVSKDIYPPDLSDNRLVNEIRKINGGPGGKFELDGYEFPSQIVKYAPAGFPGTLLAGGVSRLVDNSADFVAAGVTDDDEATVVIGGIDYTLPVRAVVGPNELEVENLGQIAAAGVSYQITTPGSQVLFRKFVSGNMFPVDDYGPMTIVHEAGLFFTNGVLFNRVVFAPASPTVGLIFQPQDINGVTLGVQVDWLIVL